MVRFRSSKRRPVSNYLSRPVQWRLLALVMALGLVLVFMNRLRQPEMALRLEAWLTGEHTSPTADQRPDSQESSDVFLVSGGVEAGDKSAASLWPTIPPETLTAIRDNTFFRSAESPAWFQLLSILKTTSPSQLAAASRGEVDYVQLVEQPHVYRAQVVTIRGTVHQVTEQLPADNDIGVTSYYRHVLQPRGGGIWPIFVYALELPPGFPQGEDVSPEVTVTGFFFKNLSYAWRDGLGIAPVILAKSVEWPVGEDATVAQQATTRMPVAQDRWTTEEEATEKAKPSGGATLRELMALAGWDAQRWAGFHDDRPLTDDERELALSLLRRLRSFDAFSLASWANHDFSWEKLSEDPAEERGELWNLTGRVRKVVRHPLSAADAARWEMPEYFECQLELEGGEGTATILTARVPRAWLEMDSLDEPASALGLFVKWLPAEDDGRSALFVSKDVAWHPTEAIEPLVSFGASVLGSLGMDVGLLDEVRNRDVILSTERDAFYEILDAVGRIGVNQLIRFARDNLAAVQVEWSAEAERLAPTGDPPRALPTQAKQRLLLAEEVMRLASEGQYSVAPLFNDAEHQVGRLVVLDGVARRTVRVEVGVSPRGGPSDVRQRFGIDHYYEIELFTDDSQNYPVVACVRDLPAGFPTGTRIQEPIRVPGFFFKSWLYHTSRAPTDSSGDTASEEMSQRQYAPLLIGPGVVWLQSDLEGGTNWGFVGGGLFVVALAGVWAAVWWYTRGDRQFRDRVIAANYSLPEGQSLGDLHVENVPQTPDIHPEVGRDTTGGP